MAYAMRPLEEVGHQAGGLHSRLPIPLESWHTPAQLKVPGPGTHPPAIHHGKHHGKHHGIAFFFS